MRVKLRVKFANTVALLFWKLGLPTGFWLWLAHFPLAGSIQIQRGSVVIASRLSLSGKVFIGKGSSIFADELTIDSGVRIGNSVKLIARKISIGTGAQIDDSVLAEGGNSPQSSLVLGPSSWIFPFCVINTTCGIEIGEGTGIGGYSMIWTHGSWQSALDGFPTKYAKTKIGDNVWLPWHVIVMPGVSIGSNVTVGAGSVVLRDVPANSLVAGSPAQVLKSGPEVWPGPQAKTRDQRIGDIVSAFARDLAVGGEFDWKASTYFGKPPSPFRLDVLNATNAVFRTSDERLAIDWSERTAREVDQPQVLTLKIYQNEVEPTARSKDFMHLAERTYKIESQHEFFKDFIRFTSTFGIHVRDLRTGLPNHRLG